MHSESVFLAARRQIISTAFLKDYRAGQTGSTSDYEEQSVVGLSTGVSEPLSEQLLRQFSVSSASRSVARASFCCGIKQQGSDWEGSSKQALSGQAFACWSAKL